MEMKKAIFGLSILACANTQGAVLNQSATELGALAAIELESRAASRGYTNIKVDVQPLDARVRLRQCDGEPAVIPDTSGRALGRLTVGLRCEAPEPWTIYVRGTVASKIEVPTLITAINRKDIIGESDLQMTDLDLATDSRGLIQRIEQIVGKEATKNLLRGQPLRKSDLKAAIVVKRGQTIDLLSRGVGITVKMRGKALGNGAEGDRLLVENLSSRKRVEGEVLATGQVLIQ